ncbi:MAG: sigma-70 family RNA polymerase sigma factor [Acidobacteriota bacterium]|nr:sigma-70 family RNA polymerase sigma factor [Acidobacteriota bacterium]
MEFSSFNEDYVAKLAARDAEVEKHFTTYFTRLLVLKLRSRVRSRHLIEDVCQETFLRVLQVLHKDDGLHHPERLGAFVNNICNNVMLEKFREAGRHSPMPDDPPDQMDTTIDLDHDIISQESKEIVERVLAELSQKDRELLRKILLEERDKDEVCREMNVTAEYLRVLLHRARQHFKDALARINAPTL